MKTIPAFAIDAVAQRIKNRDSFDMAIKNSIPTNTWLLALANIVLDNNLNDHYKLQCGKSTSGVRWVRAMYTA